ncbi:MAG: L,D-transpeptidase [Tepidisphaeraceae bacterium]
MLISISVPKDRRQYGTLSCGELSCRCYCKADNGAAIAAGNPTRDPRRKDGDTPTGTYAATLGQVELPERSYGPYRVIHLNPTVGDGVLRAQDEHLQPDDLGLLMHSGPLAKDGKSLRPTHGCIRLDDVNQKALVSLMEQTEEAVLLDVSEIQP